MPTTYAYLQLFVKLTCQLGKPLAETANPRNSVTFNITYQTLPIVMVRIFSRQCSVELRSRTNRSLLLYAISARSKPYPLMVLACQAQGQSCSPQRCLSLLDLRPGIRSTQVPGQKT